MATSATPIHRVSVAVAHARADIASILEVPVWSMTDQQAADALIELQTLKAQLAELESRIAAHADEQHVGQDKGASSTATWLAHQTHLTRPAARATVWLGRQLHARPRTRQALSTGEIHVEQARVILRWVTTIPDDHQATAEAHLLHLAAEHDAKALDRLGHRLWEVIDPDSVDERESAILAKEEAAAAKATMLRIWDDGHGKTHLKAVIPTLEGAALRKLLAAVMAAKHQNAVHGAGTGPEQMGRAFCDLITRYPITKLPKTSGLNATLVVTITEDTLMGRLEQAGILDTVEHISPGLARTLACQAGILPAVLDGTSQVLDLGRSKRLFSKAQRLALVIQQHGHCAATGCDRTTGLHAHHIQSWADLGPTDLTNAIALCHWHHRLTHDPTHETTHHPDRSVDFHRRE